MLSVEHLTFKNDLKPVLYNNIQVFLKMNYHAIIFIKTTSTHSKQKDNTVENNVLK